MEKLLDAINAFFSVYKAPNFAIIIVSLFIILFIIIVNHKLKNLNPDKPPKGILLIAETLVDWTNNLCKNALGSKWKVFAPYILFEAMFLAIANLSGLLGLTSPTSTICVPLALGIVTGFVMHFAAIKYGGMKSYLKSYLDPIPLMLPINIFSELMTPISMGLRLFGNIFSGTVVSTLLYHLFTNVLSFAINSINIPYGALIAGIVMPFIHAIFDVFLGLIQVYVFCLLSVVFIAGKIPDEVKK